MLLLEDKHAVIYGGHGALGGAVAAAFEREGATVHAVGHEEVDALDEQAVDAHAASLPRIDISFNLISHGVVQGTAIAGHGGRGLRGAGRASGARRPSSPRERRRAG